MFVLLVAVLGVMRLLTLPEPAHMPTAEAGPPLTVIPNWTGPAPVTLSGQLSDGSAYTPRVFFTTQDSVGLAQTPDRSAWRVLMVGPGAAATELRRVPASDGPQFAGFAVDGDTVVWAESVSRDGASQRTTLWRANWRTGAKAVLVTSNTGEAMFAGQEFDLVIAAGRVSWVAQGPGDQTEVRSVPLAGGQVATRRLPGAYALSRAPWAVSRGGGRGASVDLLNLDTGAQIDVPTAAAEIATCNPTWCRMAILGGDNELARIDLMRADGTGRHRIAGNEATPTITDVAMLDRFVPLMTDRTADGAGQTGLSIYDVTADRTDLLASGVALVQGHDGMLWWSTGTGDDLFWHALDLRTVS
jgi:hypothetical protein